MNRERTPLSRSAPLVAAGSILQQLVSAFSFLLLTRGLDASGYGLFAAMFALINSLYNFAGYWATPYIIAEGSRQFDRRGRLGDIYVIGIIASIVPPLVFLWPIMKISGVSVQGWKIVLALVLLLAGSAMLVCLRCAAQIFHDFKIYGRLLWLDRSLFLCLLLILLIAGRFDAPHAITALAASAVAVSLAGIAWLFPKTDVSDPEFDKSVFFKASWPIFLATAAEYFSTPALVILWMNRWYGAAPAGRVASAFVIAGFLSQPAQWITPALLPRFAADYGRADKDQGAGHLRNVVLPCTAAYAVVTTCCALMAPMLPWLLGPGFRGIEVFAAPIIATVVAEAVHMLVVPILLAHDNQRSVLLAVSARTGAFILFAACLPRSPASLGVALLLATWIRPAIEFWALRGQWTAELVFNFAFIALLSVLPGLVYASPWEAWAPAVSLGVLFFVGATLWSVRAPILAGAWKTFAALKGST